MLHARAVDGGCVINGTLPWVSNLGPDHYFGAVADIEPSGEGTKAEVMFLIRRDAPSVELRDCPSFSAMVGTNTWAVRLTDYFVGPDVLIADPVRPFLGCIRAAFILLQNGMGLGVAQGAIDSMWKVERPLGHVNEFLDDRPDELQAELDELNARIMALAKTPFGSDKEFLIDVLDARTHASELALRAAQSALLHQGARGYLMSSDVQRRVWESHFLAIVTPGYQAPAQGDCTAERRGAASVSIRVSTANGSGRSAGPPQARPAPPGAGGYVERTNVGALCLGNSTFAKRVDASMTNPKATKTAAWRRAPALPKFPTTGPVRCAA